MAKTRLAIIGLGMAAAPHAKSLRDLSDRVEVAAAFSPSADRRQAFAQTYGFPTCDDAETIFADASIGAMLLLTPPNTHLELVRRAASAGKHILLEKPLETSLERAEALVAAADQAGVKLGIVLQHRFRPVSRALAGIMNDGRLGAMVSASARLSNWRPQSYYDQSGRGTKARDGGGVLLTQAIHTLDLLISLAGLPVEVTAYATTSPVHRMETEDLAMGAIRFGNGAIGTVSATTTAYPGLPDAIDIIGTEGMARLHGTELSAQFHDGTELSATDEAAGGAGADPMAFSHHHHRAVIADFLDAIESDRSPLVTGREALKVHRLIEAILRSSETGQRQVV
ncbi:Gfo/Idh/MocA family protein [Neomesorhizobium albiziae]|nr:Gfo/Idh/MocA family oxidoreductase [Mesorhizobium albiziae]